VARITVLRPDKPEVPAPPTELAPRLAVQDGAVLTLIQNGKPRARLMLELIAAEVEKSLPLQRIEVFSKPTAAKPIDADQARMLAARSRLVITGVGD
jgi:hypothetical protein